MLAILNLLLILFVGISQKRVKTLLETLAKSAYLRVQPEQELLCECVYLSQLKIAWIASILNNHLVDFNYVSKFGMHI